MPISACTSCSGRIRGSSTASGLEGASHCIRRFISAGPFFRGPDVQRCWWVQGCKEIDPKGVYTHSNTRKCTREHTHKKKANTREHIFLVFASSFFAWKRLKKNSFHTFSRCMKRPFRTWHNSKNAPGLCLVSSSEVGGLVGSAKWCERLRDRVRERLRFGEASCFPFPPDSCAGHGCAPRPCCMLHCISWPSFLPFFLVRPALPFSGS